MKINAYAKINWYLKILSKGDDGYHDIATLFQSVSLKDSLVIKKVKSCVKFETNSKNIPAGKGNLVLKAVDALCACIGKYPSGLDIKLSKNIPASAGLGGGSADAASALTGLNKLWGAKLGRKTLTRLAASLGADVPFMLTGGLAFGRGRGEKLKFYDCAVPPMQLLIIKPDIGVPTKWAYEEFDKINVGARCNVPLRDIKKLVKALLARDFDGIKKYAANDFEKVVYKKFPEIEKIKIGLIDNGAVTALLCGSGSAVFGLFRTARARNKAYARFAKKKNMKAYKVVTI